MMKRKSKHSQSTTKPKVPKTKGFDFPLFPEVPGKKSTKSSLSRAGVERKSSLSRKSSHQRYRKSRTIVPSHSFNSSTSHRTKDQVSYKRIGSQNSGIVTSDNEYTEASSEDELRNTIFRKNQRKMMVQQQIIAVEHKDASTQYYEETYSTSVYPQNKEINSAVEPDSRREIPAYNLNNVVLNRDDYVNANNRRPVSYRSHSHKAVHQRMVDNYLAQPKVLIVPIVREGKKPRTPRSPTAYSSSSYAAPRRRILRKPWLSQPNNLQKAAIPMLRESGIGSGNIRFASGVKIHAFETPDSTESFSSGRMRNSRMRTYDLKYGREYYKNPYTHRPTTRKIKRRPRSRPSSGRSYETDNPRSSSRQRPPWGF